MYRKMFSRTSKVQKVKHRWCDITNVFAVKTQVRLTCLCSGNIPSGSSEVTVPEPETINCPSWSLASWSAPSWFELCRRSQRTTRAAGTREPLQKERKNKNNNQSKWVNHSRQCVCLSCWSRQSLLLFFLPSFQVCVVCVEENTSSSCKCSSCPKLCKRCVESVSGRTFKCVPSSLRYGPV